LNASGAESGIVVAMPRRADVDKWFRSYDNPMKEVVQAIRDVVLGADPRIDECIKWQAPTFTFSGNLASFYPKSKAHASLMFHQGAKIPGKHPRLEGTGDTSRVMKLGSVAEVKRAKAELEAIVRAWIAWREGATTAANKKSGAKKKSAKKKKSATKKKTAAKKRERA
jgi:uncharacterized protein YdhG (YjbR/CyaY superfamily)